ncbi:MAG: hypothetical protein FWF33_04930 [Clostridiales bacterium]|nr:hypothetical protein [Clostridiales bacterium]
MSLFERKKKEGEEPMAETAPAVRQGADSELLAVFTAAVAAYEAEAYIPKLSIKKIRRAAGVRPVWAVTGTNEAIEARRM